MISRDSTILGEFGTLSDAYERALSVPGNFFAVVLVLSSGGGVKFFVTPTTCARGSERASLLRKSSRNGRARTRRTERARTVRHRRPRQVAVASAIAISKPRARTPASRTIETRFGPIGASRFLISSLAAPGGDPQPTSDGRAETERGEGGGGALRSARATVRRRLPFLARFLSSKS